MANPEHLEILKQGVEVWNKWRVENPDVRPELSDTDLGKADLYGVNLSKANLSKANFREANLSHSNLNGAKLYKSNLIFALLIEANLRGSNINRANLYGANLYKADLSKSNLRGADLIRADFRNSIITDVNLYGTALDNWEIDNINCDYVYWDRERKIRTPKHRDFLPGEFEELYKQLPTFEYHFEHGFTPIDAVVMDQVVAAIHEKNPKFELKLDSFHSRGQPHAKFTILHKESIEEVRKQVANEYEGKLKVLEGQKEQLMEVIAMAVNRPQNITYNQDTINIQRVEGSAVNVKSEVKNASQTLEIGNEQKIK